MRTWEAAATHKLGSDKLSVQDCLFAPPAGLTPSTSNNNLIPDSQDPDRPIGNAKSVS